MLTDTPGGGQNWTPMVGHFSMPFDNVDGIEAFDRLGEAFKWKIAFHYQNRKSPTIVDIFKRAPLAAFVGSSANQNMAFLQKSVLAKRPAEIGILEFGRQVWEAWSQKNLTIWKLSHGNSPNFTDAERTQYLEAQWAVMHRDTGKGQGKNFLEAPVGTLFFLCHGNSPQRIGQFTSDVMPCEKGEGWLQRSYRVLTNATRSDRYTVNSKSWSPQGNSTFWKVSANDLPEFESTLLKPYFGIDLEKLTKLIEEYSELLSSNDAITSASPNASMEMPSKTFRKPINRIYYGPPGTGKTFKLNSLLKDYGQELVPTDQSKTAQQNSPSIQRFRFVTFHQSYGYEEFVEGLRPVLTNDTEAGEVQYKIREGVFKELCREARQAPDQRFAMVIDEINRGNISKIFGELITLIEADKRDPMDGTQPPAEVILAYSSEKFSVPINVDVIGTMNTADRSLALLDTALRRRFDFVALMPDTRAEADPADPDSAPLAGLVVTLESGIIDIRQLLERINERIEALYDRDHCIGHAYLTSLRNVTDGDDRFVALSHTFRNRIVPLLEEYFFEDWHKIRLVLGDNQKQDTSSQFITERDSHPQDLSNLFGNKHGLDSYATRRRYNLQISAFSNPTAYIGIYKDTALA